jgi:hypothetical protein
MAINPPQHRKVNSRPSPFPEREQQHQERIHQHRAARIILREMLADKSDLWRRVK